MNSKTLILLCVIGLAFLFPAVSAAYGYYTIPIQAISNSPGDNVRNYIGNRPVAPTTVPGNNLVYIPTTGVIEAAEIYDYSGTAGSNEAYTYYIQINNDIDKNYLIQSQSLNTNERRFTNSALNIAVTAGDYFEINRTHPVWAPNPLTNSVGGYITINATTEPGYVIPVQQASSSPADTVVNYFGWRPLAMTTQPLLYTLKTPAGGNVTHTYIYDNSSTIAGTNEAVSYYVLTDAGSTNLVQTQTLATQNRSFKNAAMNMQVDPRGSLEVTRKNPAWVTNPTGNAVGGVVFIDTSLEPTSIAKGYPIYVQTIATGTIADSTPFYFGQNPIAPTTTAAISKIYIPKAGTINKVYITFVATTTATNEVLNLYIRKNNAADTYIDQIGSTGYLWRFRNETLGLAVAAGDYIEIKGIPPVWATNPQGSFAGYVYIDYIAAIPPAGGGDIILPPVADFSANLTNMLSPAVVQFFDQSNNTVPAGATSYYWNFTDGGTLVDSTDINPVFTYTTSGSKTVNHTVVSGGVTSKATKTVTLTAAGAGASLPIAQFKLVLMDTSTQFPTAWKWNKTSLLGDGIESTFSTAQNPDFSFPSGNYKINLTVTNAFGSNSTNQTIGYNLSSPKVYFWSRTA